MTGQQTLMCPARSTMSAKEAPLATTDKSLRGECQGTLQQLALLGLVHLQVRPVCHLSMRFVSTAFWRSICSTLSFSVMMLLIQLQAESLGVGGIEALQMLPT